MKARHNGNHRLRRLTQMNAMETTDRGLTSRPPAPDRSRDPDPPQAGSGQMDADELEEHGTVQITVVGAGRVGLALGLCLSDLGHRVFCVDVDRRRLKQLSGGKSPFHEPGFEELLSKSLEQGTISFHRSLVNPVRRSQVTFIAVGTPVSEDGEVVVDFVLQAARDIAASLRGRRCGYKVIVVKSTVPPGTCGLVREVISACYENFDVVSNPEFLREGYALSDTSKPDRIVIGAESDRARSVMLNLYQELDAPCLVTDLRTAEVAKYAANAFLATSISFINEIGNLCEKVGADVTKVAEALKLDRRIGPHAPLNAGPGFAGPCLPKDLRGLISQGRACGLKMDLLRAVQDVNEEQRRKVLAKVIRALPRVQGSTVAVWGLSFKAGTDDVREAASVTIINELVKRGATVRAFDPLAEENARLVLPQATVYCSDPYEAAQEADALVILTESRIFKEADKQRLKEALKSPAIVDARNIFDPREMKAIGFDYRGIGR